MKERIEWSDRTDGYGCYYQRNHLMRFARFDIAVPGVGYHSYSGDAYTLCYGGEMVSEHQTLGGAKEAADEYLQELKAKLQ